MIVEDKLDVAYVMRELNQLRVVVSDLKAANRKNESIILDIVKKLGINKPQANSTYWTPENTDPVLSNAKRIPANRNDSVPVVAKPADSCPATRIETLPASTTTPAINPPIVADKTTERDPRFNPKPGDKLMPANGLWRKMKRLQLRKERYADETIVHYHSPSGPLGKCSLKRWREWAKKTDVVEVAE